MKLLRALHSNAVWPPSWLIAGFMLIYGGFNCAIWLVEKMTGYETGHLPEIAKLRAVLLQIAAVAYAVFRLARFHPACNRAYAVWLKLTPWNASNPLPLGPIHPVWQDAVVITVIGAIAMWHAGVDPLIALTAFGFGYLGMLTVLVAVTRRWVALVIMGFLWPAFLLPAVRGWIMAANVLAIMVVVWIAHRNALKAFPWPFVPQQAPVAAPSVLQMSIDIPVLSTQLRKSNEGWPLVSLSPKFHCPSFPFRAALAVSTLGGWWIYCALVYSKESLPPEALIFPAICIAFFRLMIYCGGIAAPLNILGRIASGRLVVPRHDQVFATPLLAVLISVLGAILLRRTDAISPATIAGLSALILYVLFAGGPVMRTWLLTGLHRFQPPSRFFNTKQTLKPV